MHTFAPGGNQLDMYSNSKAARSSSLCAHALFFCLLLAVFSPSLRAQDGVFQISSSILKAVSTDLTALAGTVKFTVTSGTTAAGGFILDYGVSIVAGGELDSTGFPGATLEETDLGAGVLTVRVPAGMGTNDFISLDGVRFDATTLDGDPVTASLSLLTGSGFTVVSGSLQVPVISEVSPGLVVDPDSDILFTYENPTFTIEEFTLTLSEGFSSAFTDAVGPLGQNVATRVQIQVGGLPDGSTLTFPDSIVSSDSAATLDVLPDLELVLPTEEGSHTIAYAFTSDVDSNIRVESFEIDFILEVETPPEEEAIVFLQATLSPDEDEDCASPCVPRYLTEFLPTEDDIPFPEFEAFFPTSLAMDQFMGLAFTNEKDFEVQVELTALDFEGSLVSGEGINNPGTLIVPGGGQTSVLLVEVFGSDILSSDLTAVVSRSRRAETATLFLVGDDENNLLDGGTAAQSPLKKFVLTNVSREGDSPFTTVHLFSPSFDTGVDVELELYDWSGEVISSKTLSLAPRGSLVQDLDPLFDVELSSFSGGYVRGSSDGDGVVAFETFGNEQAINLLAAQRTSVREASYRVAHFAVGAGFDTELNLLNVDPSKSTTLSISAFDDQGDSLLSAQEISLQSGEQAILSLASLFGLSADEFLVGSLLIEQENIFKGPFPSLPALSGSVRFVGPGGTLSASLPLFLVADSDALYPHVAQDLGFFTGVAILNLQDNDVEVTVDSIDAAGQNLGEKTMTLTSGARMSRLLVELIPATLGQVGGYFRVRGDEAVLSFALFGDLAGKLISTIPSQ